MRARARWDAGADGGPAQVVHALGAAGEQSVFDYAGMERLAAAPPP